MFKVEDGKISMIEGDFGIVLPIQIEMGEEEQITEDDCFAFKIYEKINEKPVVEKIYKNIKDNTIPLKLEEDDSKKLKVGTYYCDLDWVQENSFLNNIIAKEKFQVKEKAGEI